jgi:hypothetical protein
MSTMHKAFTKASISKSSVALDLRRSPWGGSGAGLGFEKRPVSLKEIDHGERGGGW